MCARTVTITLAELSALRDAADDYYQAAGNARDAEDVVELLTAANEQGTALDRLLAAVDRIA